MRAVESVPLAPGPSAAPTARQRFFEQLARRYAVPPEWSKGPIPDRRRRVTDKLFLALFLVCLAVMGLSTAWAFAKSSEAGFTRVRDSSGNLCGAGAAKAHPYLYLQTFSEPYRSVCVRECPSFDYRKMNPAGFAPKNGAKKQEKIAAEKPSAAPAKPTAAAAKAKKPAKPSKTATAPMRFAEFTKRYAGRSHTYEEVLVEREAFEYPKYWANERFSEAQWDAYRANFALDCLPNQQFAACKQSPDFAIYDSYAALRRVCVPLSPKAALIFNKVAARYRLGLAEDLRLLFPLFARVAVFAVLLSAALFGLIFGVPRSAAVVLAALAAISLLGVAGLVAQGLFGSGALNDPVNPLRVKYLQFWLDNRLCAMGCAGAALLAAVLLAGYALQHLRYLPAVSHMVRLAARQTLRSGLLIALSAAIFLAELAVFFGGVTALARLCSTGAVRLPAEAPLATYASPLLLKALLAVQLFGLYWVLAVLEGLRDFVIGAVTVAFYFNAPIQPLHALCHTLGHHVGSLAHFALLLPLRLARRWAGGVFALAALLGRRDCWPASSRGYETYIGSASRRFMAVTYLGSVNLWRGARTSHALIELFRGHVGPLVAAGELVGLCARLAATFLTVLFAHWAYKASLPLQQNLECLWALWVGAGALGYFVGSALHSLFARTHEAALGCYLVQLELNRQGYHFQAGPRELQEALAEVSARSQGGYRPMH